MSFFDQNFIKKPKVRRFVTRLLEGNKIRDIEVLGTKLRVHSVGEHGYLRAYRISNRSSLLRDETPIIINIASILCDGDTFVDVGANVGIYSLTLARTARLLSQVKVYAFEANPDTFSRLAAHTESLNVQAFNFAISDHNGYLDFFGGAVSGVFTSVATANSYSITDTSVTIPCRRLDEMDIVGDSLIIKIDVEDQERSVLDGAEGLFKSNRIKAIYLDGYKDKSIDRILMDRGFNLFDGRTLNPAVGGEFGLLAIKKVTT